MTCKNCFPEWLQFISFSSIVGGIKQALRVFLRNIIPPSLSTGLSEWRKLGRKLLATLKFETMQLKTASFRLLWYWFAYFCFFLFISILRSYEDRWWGGEGGERTKCVIYFDHLTLRSLDNHLYYNFSKLNFVLVIWFYESLFQTLKSFWMIIYLFLLFQWVLRIFWHNLKI